MWMIIYRHPIAKEGSLQHSVKFKAIKSITTKYNTPYKNSCKSKNTTGAPPTHQPQAWDFAIFNKDFNNVTLNQVHFPDIPLKPPRGAAELEQFSPCMTTTAIANDGGGGEISFHTVFVTANWQ